MCFRLVKKQVFVWVSKGAIKLGLAGLKKNLQALSAHAASDWKVFETLPDSGFANSQS